MLTYREGEVRSDSSWLWSQHWFKMDESTGLPKVLDEGAFFRVQAAGVKHDEARLKLTYRRKRKFWFDKVYGPERYIASVNGEILPEHIVEYAVLCLVLRKQRIEEAEQRIQDQIDERRWAKDRKARKKLARKDRRSRKKPAKPKRTPRGERPTGQLKYVGDYPPKSLKGI